MNSMKTLRRIALCTAPLWLAACAVTAPPSAPPAPVPGQWHAPLPHAGAVGDLSQWWMQLNDPALVQLMDAAQRASPGIATARARIAQARATRTTAGAALLPALDGVASTQRGFTESVGGLATTTQGALQASWEIDLLGANRAALDAAQARLEGAQALWHDARVAVAAELATSYNRLRTCEAQLAVARSDAASRAETARLTGLASDAGFQAPATAALARASSAEASGRVTQQQALCDTDIKAMVALTALDEPALRQTLATAPVQKSPSPLFTITALPAQLLAQRPDVFNAERAVAAASADVGNAQAQRYPRLTLNGSVGIAQLRTGGVSTSLDTWSIGPLALTVPIFDGGRRAANVDTAQARYEEAAALYRDRVRQAVREVEEALVQLHATAARQIDTARAVDGYQASFTATQARFDAGLASLVELEDARRTLLAAQTTATALQGERMAAWIALYRAAGGGWKDDAHPQAARTAPESHQRCENASRSANPLAGGDTDGPAKPVPWCLLEECLALCALH